VLNSTIKRDRGVAFNCMREVIASDSHSEPLVQLADVLLMPRVPMVRCIGLAEARGYSPGASMRLGRPQSCMLTLSDTERSALTAMAASRTLPYSHVRRAQIILASADGESNTAIAARFDLAVQTIGYWRRRLERVLKAINEARR
jgi:hypothetical protein